jgi:hypothetical protein
MNLFCLTAFVALTCATQAFRPGIIVTVHENEFGNLVKGVLPLINNGTKNFVMDETISEEMIDINRIEGSLDDIHSENLGFAFHPDTGIISIVVSKIWHHVKCFGVAKAKFIKSPGVITSSGMIDEVLINMNFRDFTDTQKGKPYFSVKVQQLTFNKDSFDIHADFKGIPNFIIDAIIKIFKAKLLDKIKDSILKSLDKKSDPMIDKALDKLYPQYVSLKDLDTSLSIELIQKPHIDDKNLYIEVDGTFFNTEKGYSRTQDAEDIKLQTDDQFYVDAHVTQYSVNSLINSLYHTKIHRRVFGFDVEVESLNNESNVQIDIEKFTFTKFNSLLNVSKNGLFARVNSSVNLSSAFVVRRHSDGSFWASMDVYDLKFLELDIDSSFGRQPLVSKLVQFAIRTYLRFQNNFKVKLPTIELPFNIKVDNIGAESFDKYIRFGVSIA